ncbi:MAG: hypothetical protein JXJ20_07370 [Anaerolineae bacterium]|jgi:hypothetical protein|nr:hypothetical protein [Anaerolineae bacterium]
MSFLKRLLGLSDKSDDTMPMPELDIWKAGSWWANRPRSGEQVKAVSVIGCRVGSRLTSGQINEAISSGYINRQAYIYICDTVPTDWTEDVVEHIMIEVTRLVARECKLDWGETRWAINKVPSRQHGHDAVVISSGT